MLGPLQKRLAAQVMKCSPNRVVLNPTRLDDIKEAITKADIKSLIIDKAITEKPVAGTSRSKAKKILVQKRKNRQKGPGSRKGKRTARLSQKKAWTYKVRIQRKFLKELKLKKLITTSTYQTLYRKSKGGFFRSKRHIKLYMEEHTLFTK